MRISKIEVQNFKSFDNQEFPFNNVHVIIGANASGKSNFIEIFEFLQQIKQNGIHQAIAYFGGVNSLLNFNAASREFRIKIEVDPKIRLFSKTSLTEKVLVRNTSLITYELTVRTKSKTSKEFTFKEELLFYEYFSINEFQENEVGDELERHDKTFKFGVIREFNESFNIDAPNLSKERFYYADKLEELELEFEYQAPFQQRQTSEELNHKNFKERSILEYKGFIPRNLFDFGIYDIDTKILKNTKEVSPKGVRLQKNGLYLRQIIKDIIETDKERFLTDVQDILSFISDIKVNDFEGELKFSIKEKYYQNNFTTEGLLSDGTVAVIAFIIILYYQENSIIFIEEPEHSLHPSLIEDVIEAVYDVSSFLDKQVILTTHSPQLLKFIQVLNKKEDIIIISRNENGSSILDKLENKEMAEAFLKNDLGLDVLFIQNLLNR